MVRGRARRAPPDPFGVARPVWARRPASMPDLGPYRPGKALGAAAALCGCLALGHLAASLWTTRSTSVDLVYFWGVKAVRFAQERAINVPLLGWLYFSHAVPDYPPLVPVVAAWSALVSGPTPWRGELFFAAFCLIATIPLVLSFLRRRLGDAGATAVTAFWTAALAISLAFSYSGGNAEAPLLFFETIAGVALLTEKKGDPEVSRFLPALALAGAVLTKVEGSVGAALLITGVVLRDRLQKRERVLAGAVALLAAPLAALALWFGFQYASHLQVGYRAHGEFFVLHFEYLGAILRSGVAYLAAGTSGLAWLFPILVLLLLGRDRRAALPGLLVHGGTARVPGLRLPERPARAIGADRLDAPRTSQPGLSS